MPFFSLKTILGAFEEMPAAPTNRELEQPHRKTLAASRSSGERRPHLRRASSENQSAP